MLAALLFQAGAAEAGEGTEPVTVRITASAVREPSVVDAETLVGAMHARYLGSWPTRLTIRQEVTRFEEGKPGEPEIWNEVLLLPGRVRSTIGDPADGNEEVHANGTSVILEGGKQVHRANSVHGVLLLGFDVYAQPPETTLARIAQIPVDTSKFHEEIWDDVPVYVVGADSGDSASNQFWVDRERLTLVRLMTKSPRGNLIDVQLSDPRPLGGGWIPYHLEFRRNGALVISEQYVEVGLPAQVDSTLFDVGGDGPP